MNTFDLALLKWIQENRTPSVERFFIHVTEWGEGVWLLGPLALLFWLWGARPAYRVGTALLAGDLLGSLIKNLLCIPRPWVLHPEWVPVGAAQGGAFGYSFPSGHAGSTALLWGGIAAVAQRGWVWLPALIWIGLMGLSRVVLGVHVAGDVLASWLLALLVVWGGGRAWDWAETRPSQSWRFWAGAAGLALAAGAILYWRPLPDDAGPAFGRDTYRSMAAMLAFLAAGFIERRTLHFDPARLGSYRIVAAGGGLVVLALILTHLRGLLAFWIGEHGAMYAAAAAAPAWIFLVWPFLLGPLCKTPTGNGDGQRT